MIPAKATEQAVLDHVPARMTVTVTASPVKGLEPTVDLAERLAARGYRVVPHLAARSVESQQHLEAIVARLTACGVDDVFVPGGDATDPLGPFDGALPLLERLTEMGRPFVRVGITGYPESHPKIGDDITVQAMWDKRKYASYIVSNVCFDPAGLGRWIGRIRARGVDPAAVRGAGRAGRAGQAAEDGRGGRGGRVGPLHHPAPRLDPALLGARRVQPGPVPGPRGPGYSLAPQASVAGLHLFTFNQLQPAEQWRRPRWSAPQLTSD